MSDSPEMGSYGESDDMVMNSENELCNSNLITSKTNNNDLILGGSPSLEDRSLYSPRARGWCRLATCSTSSADHTKPCSPENAVTYTHAVARR